MTYQKNLEVSVVDTLGALDFEARDQFVRTHIYNKANANYCKLNTDGLQRRKAIARYLPHYTIENFFEFCVFRNLITLLNQYQRSLRRDGSPTERSFTLGHWIPLARGGVHHPSNWVIQVYRHNNRLGDSMPASKEKWTLDEQVKYIMKNINYNLVDANYLHPMQRYIKMLKKVY
ncbi:hypothetical protein Arno18_140 [Pectobacterium phage Arno18]|uniref:Uncharacterized protein n=1 Tax=Pectobacterium phage Arno18 TaxID=2500578 RepID=A0A678ZZM7_9CAUD|nr:hypothetical protein Arno18_140 [Pectobacterium phage Arno18]